MAAVGNIQTLRRKIRSVENLKKITKAMQMVSASKLKKTQGRLMQIRPYADKITELLESLAGRVANLSHPLFTPRAESKNALVVVMAADKGLCGTYNANMIRFAGDFIKKLGKTAQVVAIGKKSADYIGRVAPLRKSYVNLPASVPFSKIQEIVGDIVGAFLNKEVDEVHVLYSKFVNALAFRPTSVAFLPVTPKKAAQVQGAAEYIFEPGPEQILNKLVPRYLETSFHRLLLEALSSEHAARMNAMRNATDNASDMISNLTLIRNKVRQAGITKELLDIVTGAEALKGK